MIIQKQYRIYFPIFLLFLTVPISIYGQDRKDKTVAILNELEFVEQQKFEIIDFKIRPLKYQATEKDSLKLIEIEKQLTEEEFLKRISNAFNEIFTEEEINDTYSFLQTTAFEKFFDAEQIYDAISIQFDDINEELEKISNNLKEVDEKPIGKNELIPIEREDGIYATVDYNVSAKKKDIKLEDKASITKRDILEVKKVFNNNRLLIDLILTKEGARKFYLLTKKNILKPLAIVIGKQIVSMPTVQSEILGGRVSIAGDFSEEEIDNMIEKLKEK